MSKRDWKINILYLSPWPLGGFTSFTSHLYRALMQEGWDVSVIRCNKDRDEKNPRQNKTHDFVYRNVSVKTALKMAKSTPTIFGAVCRPEDCVDPQTIPKLIDAGAIVRVASTQEFKQFPHVKELTLGKRSPKVIVIRRSLAKLFPNAVYLPHPYTPHEGVERMPWSKRERACSIAMVATNKNPKIILDANRKVKKSLRVKFIGRETTPWIGMALKKYDDRYEKPVGFKSSREAVEHASKYKLAVDLSVYLNEGGGTQFCFLEAADAGCVNVLHRKWTDAKGDMVEGENCIAVGDAQELAEVLRGNTGSYKIGNQELLHQHSPSVISHVLRRIL